MKNSRRRFLTLGLTSGALAMTNSTDARTSEPTDMVQMLTPDGKLVEVPRHIVDQSSKEDARNEDILNWSKSIKS